ncbi:SLC22A4_5 [Mytilus coruscus]|uniref:SLC22A4_5 n=1 Tax=Mytilus coruscus TaxID=42192 RepID=A0A6J8AS86_MYTCO|nr:SLC22A4_5 [Mytilus coruscus]
MDVDSTFEIVGEFGPYQKRIYFLLCLMPFMTSFHTLLSSFILATPDHRCALPNWPNDTYKIQSEAHREDVNRSIPLSSEDGYLYDGCTIYGNSSELVNCEKWVYAKTVFESTFTSEQNFVCDDELKTSHAAMIFFCGVLTGALGFGSLSDLLIPESPRWLLSQGKHEEAVKILKKIAKGNNRNVDEKAFGNLTVQEEPAGRFWHLIDNPVLFKRTLIILINWMFASMAYYGLSLNTGDLSGDYYLNFFLSGLAEFPAYTICLLLLDRIGRKTLHVSCMVFGGIFCICAIFPMLYASEDLQPITVTLAMLGKVGIAAAYGIIYVWSAELYPTVVRNQGMGLSSTMANTGALVSPYVADLNKAVSGHVGRALPFVLFGGCALLAGLLALMLPETLNQHLPETIEDGINFGKKPNNKYKSEFCKFSWR